MRVYTQMKHCADVIGQGTTSPLSRCAGPISIEAEAFLYSKGRSIDVVAGGGGKREKASKTRKLKHGHGKV